VERDDALGGAEIEQLEHLQLAGPRGSSQERPGAGDRPQARGAVDVLDVEGLTLIVGATHPAGIAPAPRDATTTAVWRASCSGSSRHGHAEEAGVHLIGVAPGRRGCGVAGRDLPVLLDHAAPGISCVAMHLDI
jgi:hypothetical protein